ncbi:MAG: hypothetical protein FJW21_06500 [Acidimicrobiia bacterium]|nr:hypothetical protein [Acidimicrobiia bacterium]
MRYNFVSVRTNSELSATAGEAERDPWTYAAAMGFLLLVAAIASLLPARRLLRLDPAVTLRG